MKRSFAFALAGLKLAASTHKNFKTQLVLAASASFLAWFLGFSRIEWLVLLITIGLVLMAELVNTSLESVVDLVSQERRLQAKVAKDVSAGMVLIAALTSVVIGGLLFLPKILEH